MRMRRVLLRDMVVRGRIGVHAHEHGSPQRIRVGIELSVAERLDARGRPVPPRDEIGEVVDYERLAGLVRATVAAGHVKLVETLAERIARASLFDPAIERVRVRVEKLDVFDDIAAVGVEIERVRDDLSTAAD